MGRSRSSRGSVGDAVGHVTPHIEDGYKDSRIRSDLGGTPAPVYRPGGLVYH